MEASNLITEQRQGPESAKAIRSTDITFVESRRADGQMPGTVSFIDDRNNMKRGYILDDGEELLQGPHGPNGEDRVPYIVLKDEQDRVVSHIELSDYANWRESKLDPDGNAKASEHRLIQGPVIARCTIDFKTGQWVMNATNLDTKESVQATMGANEHYILLEHGEARPLLQAVQRTDRNGKEHIIPLADYLSTRLDQRLKMPRVSGALATLKATEMPIASSRLRMTDEAYAAFTSTGIDNIKERVDEFAFPEDLDIFVENMSRMLAQGESVGFSPAEISKKFFDRLENMLLAGNDSGFIGVRSHASSLQGMSREESTKFAFVSKLAWSLGLNRSDPTRSEDGIGFTFSLPNTDPSAMEVLPTGGDQGGLLPHTVLPETLTLGAGFVNETLNMLVARHYLRNITDRTALAQEISSVDTMIHDGAVTTTTREAESNGKLTFYRNIAEVKGFQLGDPRRLITQVGDSRTSVYAMPVLGRKPGF